MTLWRVGRLAKQLLLALQRRNRTSTAQELQFDPQRTDTDPRSQLGLLKQGVVQWNAWRIQHPAIQPDLRGVNLHGADLLGADLSDANLQGADLSRSLLSGADLRGAHLEGANLSRACFAGQRREGIVDSPPANLQHVFFDHTTNLESVILADARGRAVLLADAHWNDVNLTVVDWTPLRKIGDDQQADRRKYLSSYRRAARANHQLAVALGAQGLSDEASRFAYRTRVRQREALLLQALLRPAAVHKHRWLVHVLSLRRGKPRFWRALAIVLPALLCVVTLLFALSYEPPLIVGTIFLLLVCITLAALWLSVPPLPKLVFSLLLLTIGLPALSVLLPLALLLGLLTVLLGSVVSLPGGLFFIAAQILVIGISLGIVLWRLSPRWFLPVRGRLLPLLEGYRSLYPLLGQTLVDYGRFVFSVFLDKLAGYGYKPWKTVICYLVVIVFFAVFYLVIGYTDGMMAALAAHQTVVVPLLTPLEAFVYSVISFHGRGFFPSGGIGLGDLLVVGAACEAVVGLVIEVSFIATFTQRFLGR